MGAGPDNIEVVLAVTIKKFGPIGRGTTVVAVPSFEAVNAY